MNGDDLCGAGFLDSWLDRELTEAEVADMVEMNRDRATDGTGQALEWSLFLSNIQMGGEVWSFCTPKLCWEIGLGQMDYALFRNGERVTIAVIKCN